MENVLVWVSLLIHKISMCHIYIKQTNPLKIELYANSLFQFLMKHRHLSHWSHTYSQKNGSIISKMYDIYYSLVSTYRCGASLDTAMPSVIGWVLVT